MRMRTVSYTKDSRALLRFKKKPEANGAASAVSRVMAEVTNAVVCGDYTTFQIMLLQGSIM